MAITLRACSAALTRRGFLATAFAGCVGSGLALPALAVAAGDDEKPVTSREGREEAHRAIPWDKMNEEAQRKILSVVERPSIYRRMPKKTVECDADLFLFLLRNPEVVVNMWQVMGVSNMTAQRTSPFTWTGNDGAGTICKVELAYGTEELHLIYGEGYYEGPLFRKKMTGRCVLLLRSAYEKGDDERTRVGNLLDVFLTIDNAGLDLIAKTLSPLVGSTADTNFAETAKFIGRISYTAEQNGAGLHRLAGKLTKVDPPVREEFIQLTTAVGEKAALRSASGTTEPKRR